MKMCNPIWTSLTVSSFFTMAYIFGRHFLPNWIFFLKWRKLAFQTSWQFSYKAQVATNICILMVHFVCLSQGFCVGIISILQGVFLHPSHGDVLQTLELKSSLLQFLQKQQDSSETRNYQESSLEVFRVFVFSGKIAEAVSLVKYPGELIWTVLRRDQFIVLLGLKMKRRKENCSSSATGK